MNTIDSSSSKKIVSLMVISFIMMISCYAYHNYVTYDSISVVMKDTAAIEYGSSNYDLKELIQEVDGDIISVKKDIDTNVIGQQEMIIEVKKDNIIKDVPIVISVIDSVPPVIKLKKEKITINKDEKVNLVSNIKSVIDDVDGEIKFLDKSSSDNNYYDISYNGDLNSIGNHDITVTATDNYGNVSSTTFVLEVRKPKVVVPVMPVVSTNLPANAASGSLTSIAYSLVGSPYVAGSNGPYGFDCSGFVQYVYSKVGINISRSATTQIYDGVGVSYQDAKPGDILSWGYADGIPTHSAIYVGNGQMIHATNPSQGVIASDVAAWTRGSGTRVIAVRRIQ